jgi:L-cystine transport system substrate-binding protein
VTPNKLRRTLSATLALCVAPFARAQTEWSPLEKIKQRGVLRIAVYNDLAPFHVKGVGIDVDLGNALANALGLKAAFLPFDADDNLTDDLRNMVWKGHYLGYGPADLMLHVPVDRRLMDDNKQVLIFAPYFRETMAIARDLSKLPKLDSLEAFTREKIGVDGTGFGALIMAGTEGGRYRNSLMVYKSPQLALQALVAGDVPAVMANRSEVHHVLKRDGRYAVSDVPTALGAAKNGWVVGMAVKKDNEPLAKLLMEAMNQLSANGQLKAMFEHYQVDLTKP